MLHSYQPLFLLFYCSHLAERVVSAFDSVYYGPQFTASFWLHIGYVRTRQQDAKLLRGQSCGSLTRICGYF